ncbi:PH domain-containing protein [Simiduia sp. 21SJ11W-1]|uniref:PH domain-containing protein n=1 Tax=Simiduia sp. 21SJ11W-1 TaxID=2909669 RepID=UPI0020A0DCAE|nr:PH domain-containing protein [Simiduia sp. 21SJ11W-1]UTA47825.1 PH domain-containing protein [Simiduia sp. 21SJ11W-1]
MRCGPFSWHLRCSDITAITPTNTPLSGPALSFDKLQLTYNNGKCLLISPADKAGFLAAIGWATTPSGCQKAAS